MNEYKIWLAKILTLCALFFLLVSAVGVLGRTDKGPSVSVIDLEGVIEDSADVLETLYRDAHDDRTKAIVVRIDSPGGAVGPSEEIYSAINRLKSEKPIVVSMGSVAASGGLYAALGASKIFANRSTQTGSIGVIMQIPNYSSVAEKVGFSMVTVKAGALKDAGNPFRPMTETEKAFLEDAALKVHKTFIAAVVEGRQLSEEKVKGFADGRVLLGSEAKDLGLIDDFGDVYDAARAALLLANVPIEDDEVPNLVAANKKKGTIAKLLEGASSLGSFVESAVPSVSRGELRLLAY